MISHLSQEVWVGVRQKELREENVSSWKEWVTLWNSAESRNSGLREINTLEKLIILTRA